MGALPYWATSSPTVITDVLDRFVEVLIGQRFCVLGKVGMHRCTPSLDV